MEKERSTNQTNSQNKQCKGTDKKSGNQTTNQK